MKHAFAFTACVLGCAGNPPPAPTSPRAPTAPAAPVAQPSPPAPPAPPAPRPIHTIAWNYGAASRPIEIRVAHHVRTTGKTTTLAVGSPHATIPTTTLTNYADFTARAIVRRTVMLGDCAAPPVAPAGYRVVDGVITAPPFPSQIDPGTTRVVALDLTVELPCNGPWQAFLTGPIDTALRQRGATVAVSEYVPIDRKAIDAMAYSLPPEIVGAARAHFDAGKALAILPGAPLLGLAPATPAVVDVRARVLENEPLVCEVDAGRFEGAPLRYQRRLEGDTDRSYVTATTPDPILVSPVIGGPFGARQELALPRRPDTSCSADLRPKLARDRAAALRIGVPAALLDAPGAIDFRTQSLVVFARPTSIEESHLAVGVSSPGEPCPGGRPPDADRDQAPHRPIAVAPQPRYVSGLDLARALVIKKGEQVPKLGFAPMPAEPCRPRPDRS